MMLRSGHLKDNHLLDCYVARHAGDLPDPRMVDHLFSCQACGTRYDELSAVLNEVRAHADQELDAQFPAERLATQRQQILRRLEHVNRPAKVITFPGRDASNPAKPPALLPTRWLAAAAAAGLFIGVAVGGYLGPRRFQAGAVTSIATKAPAMMVQPSAPAAAIRVGTTQAEPDDEAFLLELDLALARPSTRELLPFDAMTPHALDIDVRQR